MRKALHLTVFASCTAVLIASLAFSVAEADGVEATRPAAVSLYGDPGSPDISGLWLGTALGVPGQSFGPGRGPADGRPPTYWAPYPLPYTPTYQKISDERAEAAKRGVQLGDTSARCLPFGMPRALVSKYYQDEIVQTPGEVTILVNNTFPIVIWTDGRSHPKELVPSYNGHSIGYWVGDTLFVDTVGINGATALDAMREPHSAQLHVKSSIQRMSKEVLHVHVTLYDQGAFTEPVVTTNIWHRMSGHEWQVLDDASCFENNRSLPGTGGVDGFLTF